MALAISYSYCFSTLDFLSQIMHGMKKEIEGLYSYSFFFHSYFFLYLFYYYFILFYLIILFSFLFFLSILLFPLSLQAQVDYYVLGYKQTKEN